MAKTTEDLAPCGLKWDADAKWKHICGAVGEWLGSTLFSVAIGWGLYLPWLGFKRLSPKPTAVPTQLKPDSFLMSH